MPRMWYRYVPLINADLLSAFFFYYLKYSSNCSLARVLFSAHFLFLWATSAFKFVWKLKVNTNLQPTWILFCFLSKQSVKSSTEKSALNRWSFVKASKMEVTSFQVVLIKVHAFDLRSQFCSKWIPTKALWGPEFDVTKQAFCLHLEMRMPKPVLGYPFKNFETWC